MAQFPDVPKLNVNDLIQELQEAKLFNLVKQNEMDFLKQSQRIAAHLAWDLDIRVVFISGPSASGKTTFTKRLASAIKAYGRKSAMISMDDYYLGEVFFEFENGLPDYERVENLDIEQMAQDIKALLAGETVHIPRFDFEQRQRVILDEHRLKLKPHSLLLIEGLHSMNDQLRRLLPKEACYGIFIMPYAELQIGEETMYSEDERILRRLCRDLRHRASNPLATLDYWPVLRQSEQSYFQDYLSAADVFVNSMIPYEYLLIPGLAKTQIEADLKAAETGTLSASIYVKKAPSLQGQAYADLETAIETAQRLVRLCEKLPAIDPKIVPPQSILNEFIR